MNYKIKNWKNFQHYHDRCPPWIKLHFSMLHSNDWVMLDDASRVLMIACMLVASRNEGEVDGSDAGLCYLQRVAYLKRKPSLKSLIDCGFLECASGCKQEIAKDTTETENIKKEREEESADKPSAPTKGNGKFHKPTLIEIQEYCQQIDAKINPVTLFNHYESNGWKVGKNPMIDWKATVRNWNSREATR